MPLNAKPPLNVKPTPAKEQTRQKISQAQQQIFDLVQELEDMKSFINALAEIGDKLFIRASNSHKDFFDGLKLINQALNAKYTDALSMCVPLIGAGGDAAKKFSRERFAAVFGDNTKTVMRFLDKYGNAPNHWNNADEAGLHAEVAEIIAEHKASGDTPRKISLNNKPTKKPAAKPLLYSADEPVPYSADEPVPYSANEPEAKPARVAPGTAEIFKALRDAVPDEDDAW